MRSKKGRIFVRSVGFVRGKIFVFAYLFVSIVHNYAISYVYQEFNLEGRLPPI